MTRKKLSRFPQQRIEQGKGIVPALKLICDSNTHSISCLTGFLVEPFNKDLLVNDPMDERHCPDRLNISWKPADIWTVYEQLRMPEDDWNWKIRISYPGVVIFDGAYRCTVPLSLSLHDSSQLGDVVSVNMYLVSNAMWTFCIEI